MNLPDVKNGDQTSISTGTNLPESGNGRGDCSPVVEQGAQPWVSGPEFPKGVGTTREVPGELEGSHGDFDHAPEITPGDCVGLISRADARYQKRDPECEADYRAAFFLDARLTAYEIIRRLEDDIRGDLSSVLMDCRNHLLVDHRDVVAQARLGLTLLLHYQDVEGFEQLHRVFRQNPDWRPLLRLLVNEAKQSRATLPNRIIQRD